MTLDPRVNTDTRSWLAPAAKGMWCDGQAVSAVSGRTFIVHDPATETALGEVPDAGAADVDRAVASARTALEGPWGRMSAADRERRLLRLADLVELNAESLQHLIVLENGKLLSAARREVDGCTRFARYAAGWATKITGQTLDVSMRSAGTDTFAYTRREPVGIVAGIIPWNVPLSMAVWKSVPALACGCTVILKPAPDTPFSALRFAELALEAGIPPGALNVVTGGAGAGAALVAHAGVDKIAFTGSSAVGRMIGGSAMQQLKRVSLELGGKSPAVVFGDADPSSAASAVAEGIFYNQGQICAAGSRLYVERSVFDEVVSRVADIARTMRLGSGLDAESDLGPLVSSRQRDRVAQFVATGVAEGATALAGGKAPSRPGFFMEPTVLVDTTPDMEVVREEIFGPVLVAMPFDTEDELMEYVNGTTYGLSASLYSQNLSRINRLIPRIRAGSVFVNSPARTDPNLPLGGVKASGVGREHGSSMIELYTELKSVVIRYDL
jgi:phenylacetaldehyde dehydrogenase